MTLGPSRRSIHASEYIADFTGSLSEQLEISMTAGELCFSKLVYSLFPHRILLRQINSIIHLTQIWNKREDRIIEGVRGI